MIEVLRVSRSDETTGICAFATAPELTAYLAESAGQQPLSPWCSMALFVHAAYANFEFGRHLNSFSHSNDDNRAPQRPQSDSLVWNSTVIVEPGKHF